MTDDLTDFKPLEQVSLPDIGDLHCSGLILFVGPNSSGKSQFLKDVYHRLCGEPRSLVVATEVRIRKPDDFPHFIKYLETRGYFSSFEDDDGIKQFRPTTTYLGSGQGLSTIKSDQAQSWHQTYIPAAEPSFKNRNDPFLNYFGRLLVTALFLERRLASVGQVGVIDFVNQPPQNDLQALYLDETARDQLYAELRDSFGKAVWPDASQGNMLCLRVSDDKILPLPVQRLSPKKMYVYREMGTEGDGLKSYVAICMALLLGRRPVCLIDEPEMCLHPPQAYNLGRFIGRHGTSPDSATFVATHSSHVLRGVIQTAREVQIVRLTRRNGLFAAHLVPTDILSSALTKPAVRAESVLDGIFAQAVVVVEADGDRLVYQTTWEAIGTEPRLDIHFAAVGGTGGIADTCKLYRTLNIPIAVIADLDMIADPDGLRRVLEVVAAPEVAKSLSQKASSILQMIRELPPTITPEEVKDAVKKLSISLMIWENDDDIEVQRQLNRLAQKLDRMRQLKDGGISKLPPTIAGPLHDLVSSLKKMGIFLVPVGELEQWLVGENITASKAKKSAWASEAAQVIQSKKDTGVGDIWAFVHEVGTYLTTPVAIDDTPAVLESPLSTQGAINPL
jgi:hypothetical protein